MTDAKTIHKKRKIKLSADDKIYYTLIHIFLIVLLIIVLYPLIYIISASFSSPYAVSSGRVILLPVDLSLEGYKAVFKNPDIFTGYRNTIVYTVLGTLINIGREETFLCFFLPLP